METTNKGKAMILAILILTLYLVGAPIATLWLLGVLKLNRRFDEKFEK